MSDHVFAAVSKEAYTQLFLQKADAESRAERLRSELLLALEQRDAAVSALTNIAHIYAGKPVGQIASRAVERATDAPTPRVCAEGDAS